jgi:hypothetical protein
MVFLCRLQRDRMSQTDTACFCILVEDGRVDQLDNSPPITESEGSLPYLQKPLLGYPEPDEQQQLFP